MHQHSSARLPGPSPAAVSAAARRTTPLRARLLGTAALAAGSAALAALLLVRLLTLVHAVRTGSALGRGPGPDDLVELAVTGIGALVCLWWALSALVAVACLGTRAAGRAWHGGEALVRAAAPALVRRGLVLALGAGLGLAGGTAAVAAPPASGPAVTGSPATATSVPTAVADLGWPVTTPTTAPAPVGATPAPPTATAAAGTSTVTAGPGATPTTTAHRVDDPARIAADVVVRPGDTLWAIAARALPPGADDDRVAAAWPTWYAANRATVGPDPDLIRPGQVLHAPTDVR